MANAPYINSTAAEHRQSSVREQPAPAAAPRSHEKSPVFVVGEWRSGTTLMRVMLDSHKNICCGPETQFIVQPGLEEFHNTFTDRWFFRIKEFGYQKDIVDKMIAAMIDEFFTTYQLQKGKKRWADKTPQGVLKLDYLLRLFPRAQFIHMIRDGRDVACSAMKKKWGPKTIEDAAHHWILCIEKAKAFSQKHPEKIFEVRYETLVHTPEQIMREVLRFLGEPWDPHVLNHHSTNHDLALGLESSAEQVQQAVYTSSIGIWKKELPEKDRDLFHSIAGRTLQELDYL